MWCNKFQFTQKGGGFALCIVCRSDFNVEHGGENNSNIHKDTSKHKRYVDAVQQQRKLTNFGASSATEQPFSGFLVEHNLPLRNADCTAKLFRNMFPDSKAVNKYPSGYMKTTHML